MADPFESYRICIECLMPQEKQRICRKRLKWMLDSVRKIPIEFNRVNQMPNIGKIPKDFDP